MLSLIIAKLVIKIIFYINYKITCNDSLNNIYSSKHWTHRKSYVNAIHTIVRNALKSNRVPKEIFRRPVAIRLVYPLDNLDIDNHGYFAKCVVDGLKGWVIKDDTRKYVVEICQRFESRENIKVEVCEVEADNC